MIEEPGGSPNRPVTNPTDEEPVGTGESVDDATYADRVRPLLDWLDREAADAWGHQQLTLDVREHA